MNEFNSTADGSGPPTRRSDDNYRQQVFPGWHQDHKGLWEYAEAAIQILGLNPVFASENPKAPSPQPNGKTWFLRRWEAVAAELASGGWNTNKDDFWRMIKGRQNNRLKTIHAKIFHRVLDLNVYGLSIDDLWTGQNEVRLRLSIDEFESKLRDVQASSPDPLHWLRLKSDPSLSLMIDDSRNLAAAFGIPNAAMPFEELIAIARKETGRSPPAAEVKEFTVYINARMVVMVTPRARGHIFLISYQRGRDPSSFMMNGYIDSKPPSQLYEEHVPVGFGGTKTVNNASVSEVVAVNWPAGRSLAADGLEFLLRHDRVLVGDDALRRLGSAVLDSAGLPDGQRVRAYVARLTVKPK